MAALPTPAYDHSLVNDLPVTLIYCGFVKKCLLPVDFDKFSHCYHDQWCPFRTMWQRSPSSSQAWAAEEVRNICYIPSPRTMTATMLFDGGWAAAAAAIIIVETHEVRQLGG